MGILTRIIIVMALALIGYEDYNYFHPKNTYLPASAPIRPAFINKHLDKLTKCVL